MRRTCLAAVAAVTLALSAPASAVLMLTLSGPINGNTFGPQSTSNPCIIAATQCQQPASMGFNNFVSSGNISSYNAYSTTPTAVLPDGTPGTPYTVSQIVNTIGSSSFNIAIDVNTTSANSEVLQFFNVFVNGVLFANYTGPHNLAPVFQNGNGFGDWSLGVVSLAGLSPTDTVLFQANWTGAVDGGESFFLVAGSTPPPLPEPSTVLLLGLALALMGWRLRTR